MSSSIPSTTPTLSSRAQACAKPSQSPLWSIYADPWHATSNPDGYVNVGVAENTLCHAELASFTREAMTSITNKALTYGDGPLGSTRLRDAVARFWNRRLSPVAPVEAEHVVVTNGVSASIEHTSWAFCDPGDGFLLGRPHYRAFIPDISLRPGVHVVAVEFGPDIDPLSVEAVDAYEKAILDARKRGVQPKALMLCSPHNPLGRCYPRAALLAYMRLCNKYGVHLVSDEIYAFTTWENRFDGETPQYRSEPFTSVLSIPPDGVIDPAYVHVLWGMSKDFGANGLRVGYIISQHNAAFRKALLEVAMYSYASSLADHVAARILEDHAFVDGYITLNQRRLRDAYGVVVEELQRRGVAYQTGTNAAFFVWLDLGEAYLRNHPGHELAEGGKVTDALTDHVMQLLMREKVFLGSGSYFGAEAPGWFRFVFTHPREYVEEALRRVLRAIE